MGHWCVGLNLVTLKLQQRETFNLSRVEHSQGKMEFLGKQVFEHQHKEFVSSNLDRGCFDRKMLEDSVDQNLGMILVEMKVVEFAPMAANGVCPTML